MDFKNSLLRIYFFLEGLYYKFMDFIDKKLRIPVYRFFISPLEERRIPSFPVFVLIVVVVLAVLFIVLSPSHGISSNTFVVRVLSNGSGVENASVVFIGEGNSFLGRVFTDAGGTAAFTGAALSADVNAGGFDEQKVVLQPGLNVVSLEAVVSNTSTVQNVSPNQQVSFSNASTTLPGNGQRLNGSSSLEVDLFYDGAPVDGFVTVYDNSTSYVVDSSQTSGGVASFSDFSPNEAVYFSVSGNYSLSSSPVVVLNNGFNDVQLNVSSLSGGCVGSGCSVSCSSGSDCPSSSPFCVAGFCSSLNQSGNGGSGSYIYLLNSMDNSSVNGFVAVFNLANQLVSSGRTVNGSFAFNVLQGNYYAVVNAPGFVDGQTTVFSTPVDYSVSLTPASVASASLSVSIFDDENNSVPTGSVAVESLSNGMWMPLTANPVNISNGFASFSDLPVNTTVKVVASDGRGDVGSNFPYLLDGLNSVNVYIFSNYGFLNVSAFDSVTGQALTSFNASVSFSNVVFGNQSASCSSGVNGCLLKVGVGSLWYVNFSALGYYSDVVPASVNFNSTISVVDNLTPLGAGGVSLAGVYDSNWKAVSSMLFGDFYNACFNIHTNDSLSPVSSGFFFTSTPMINISSWNSSVAGSGGAGGSCPDFNSRAVPGNNYSSLNLTSLGGLNGFYCFGFTPVPTGDVWDNLSLQYSSFAFFKNGSFFFPPFSSSSVCGLNVSQSFYGVSSPNDVCGSGCGFSGPGNLSVGMSQVLGNGSSYSCGDGLPDSNCNGFQAFSDPSQTGIAGPLNVSFTIFPSSFSENFLVFSSPGNTILSVNLTNGASAVPVQNVPNGWGVSGGLNGGVINGYVLLNLSIDPSSSFSSPVSTLSAVNVNFSNGSSSVGVSFSVNSTPLYLPNILGGYDCANVSFVELNYSYPLAIAAGSKTGWIASCKSVPMVISDVFPADAVKVYYPASSATYSTSFVNASLSGAEKCFYVDSSLSGSDSNGNYVVVKFNPYYSSSCPLHVLGNSLVDSNGNPVSSVSALLPFYYSSSVVSKNNCEDLNGWQGDCFFLNFTLSNFISTGEGLNLLPVATQGYSYNVASQWFYQGVYEWFNTSDVHSVPFGSTYYGTVSGCNLTSNNGNNLPYPPSDITDLVANCSGILHSCSTPSYFNMGACYLGNCPPQGEYYYSTCDNIEPVFYYASTQGLKLNTYSLNPQVWVLINNDQFARNILFNSSSVNVGFTGPGVQAVGVENGVNLLQSGLLSENLNGINLPLNADTSFNSGVTSIVSNPYFKQDIDNYLDFYDNSFSSINGVLANINRLSTLNTANPGVINPATSYNVSSYLNNVSEILNSTALWRSQPNIEWCGKTSSSGCNDLQCYPLEQDWINLSFNSNGVFSSWLNCSSLTQMEVAGSSASDPGAPLKYFASGSTGYGSFSFFKVFNVVNCTNDNCFLFNKQSTLASSPVCNSIASAVNNILSVSYDSNGVFSHLIPRGVYVVNYTYTFNSTSGNPYDGYNGWSISSTPLLLNSSYYYQPTTSCNLNGGGSFVTPLCGYVFSTNNNYNTNPISQAYLSPIGLGNCVFSSANAINNSDLNFNNNVKINNFNNNVVSIDDYNCWKNQLFNGSAYFSSLIPINFSPVAQISSGFTVQNFVSVVGCPNGKVGCGAVNLNNNLFKIFVVDDSGDIGIAYCNNPCTSHGNADGSCSATRNMDIAGNYSNFIPNEDMGTAPGSAISDTGRGRQSYWIWPYFDGLGLH